MENSKTTRNQKLRIEFQQKPPCLVRWGFHPSPYKPLMIGLTETGVLCRVEFTRGRKAPAILKEWQKAWPDTEFVQDKGATAAVANAIAKGRKLPRLLMTGTKFQQDVWKELLKIPAGKVVSYAEVAKRIKRPLAIRAVGTACGANPIPIIVPCHRVVTSNGTLGGFGGGLPLKQKMLEAEGVRNLAA